MTSLIFPPEFLPPSPAAAAAVAAGQSDETKPAGVAIQLTIFVKPVYTAKPHDGWMLL